MSGARERILQRVREACRTARIPDAPGAELEPSPLIAQPELWLERFQTELEALKSGCVIASDVEAVRERVRHEIEGQIVLGWDPERLPYELGEHLGGAKRYLRDDAPGEEKEQAEVGLTGVTLAVAETGSLVVLPRAGEPRTASLLARKHVAIVRQDQMRASLEQAFTEIQPMLSEVSQVAVITGQSRSADIELSLILGMHGPAELLVIVGPAAGER